jgi:hypothetical protein
VQENTAGPVLDHIGISSSLTTSGCSEQIGSAVVDHENNYQLGFIKGRGLSIAASLGDEIN